MYCDVLLEDFKEANCKLVKILKYAEDLEWSQDLENKSVMFIFVINSVNKKVFEILI